MNQKHKSRLQLFLIATGSLALLYVYGVACTSDLNMLTVEQTFARAGIGVMYWAITVITYKILGKEE